MKLGTQPVRLRSVMTECFVLDWDSAATVVGSVVDRNEQSLTSKFTRGLALDPTQKPIGLVASLETSPRGPYPDYFTLEQVPVASAGFVEALRAVVDNFEAYPVDIVDPKKRVTGYFVLNVVGRVACMNRAATRATFIDDDSDVILRVKKLALDPNKASGLDLFRLDEFELLVLVSSRVKKALNGLRGVRLSAAEGWSDRVWY